MGVLLVFITLIVSYLVSGLNPAIILSKHIYHKDIREAGSGNPGFTNFRRVFGKKLAALVFILDISKAVLLELLFGFLFKKYFGVEYKAAGIAVSGLGAMLGHSFPVWYQFKGGKGFLVCFATLCVLDWKIGILVFIFMFTTLCITKYMSFSTIISMILGVLLLPLAKLGIIPDILFFSCVFLMICRHHENIKRLFKGEENKTYVFHQKIQKEKSNTQKLQ